jgi:AcrR family transcriptional regulator
MLRVAHQIVRSEGWSALRIRDLVQRAGVNLGMFHYHFRSKENFKKIVLRELYEDFFQRFIVVAREGTDPLLQLRNSLLVLGLTARDERRLLVSLLRDVLNEDPEIIELLHSTMSRHASVISRLIQQCQREARIADMPMAQALSFLMTSMNFPTLIGAVLERPSSRLSKKWMHQFRDTVLSDEAIAQRVDFALHGLTKGSKT